jgi:L-seryl-tRNA(Ser) seleniumtransferase
LAVEEVPDPTGNPISRLRVRFRDPRPQAVAWLSRELRAGEPSVFVRDHHVDNGYFDLDPCNLDDEEAETLLDRVDAILDRDGPPRARRDGGPLGPRRSRYDERGIPRVDEERVPFLIARDADRAERFARWPNLESS